MCELHRGIMWGGGLWRIFFTPPPVNYFLVTFLKYMGGGVSLHPLINLSRYEYSELN